MEILRQRKDFVAASRAKKFVTKSLILQRRHRSDDQNGAVRVGFTASKKVGNAVIRNRAKRRLRVLAREIIGSQGLPGSDYVLIARAEHTVSRPFDQLRADLAQAVQKVNG